MPKNTSKRIDHPEYHAIPLPKLPRRPELDDTTASIPNSAHLLFTRLPGGSYCGTNNSTLLHYSVTQQKHDWIEILLDHPSFQTQLNLLDDQGETAFGRACRLGDESSVILFLDQVNCDINKSGPGKETPLEAAVANGHLHIVKILLKEPGIIVDHVWSRCLAKAIQTGRANLIERLMLWLMDLSFKEQPELDAYELPMIPPPDPQKFLYVIFKYGICVKSWHADIHLPTWYQTAIQEWCTNKNRKNLPLPILPITEQLFDSDAVPISKDTFKVLCTLPSFALVNWLQGFIKTHPKWSRIALKLTHQRYRNNTGEMLPLWDKSTELLLVCNDVTIIDSELKKYGAQSVLHWVDLVINSPETFLYHETYKRIRELLTHFLAERLPQKPMTASTTNACSFFSNPSTHASQCTSCVTDSMTSDPYLSQLHFRSPL